jgi:mitochondrial chaperone BCS1
MWQLLKQMFGGQNQFTTGGLTLMIVGGIGVYLRAIPLRIWYWMVNQTTMEITVKDDDSAFVWVKEWFLDQKFLKRLRRVDLDTTLRGARVSLIPAPGSHWFWHAGRPFKVYFYRSVEASGGYTPRRMESLIFCTIGRKQAFLQQFVDGIVQSHQKREVAHSRLFIYDDGWYQSQSYTPRCLQSVILQPGNKERLVADIAKFRASRSRYRKLGVPYHRGYLFYGPPGTGKSSLVSAIADRFAMSVYAVNLIAFNDRSLSTAINDVPPDSVVLFEDIDCMKTGEARAGVSPGVADKNTKPGEKENARAAFSVTLSGLLNVLDGFHAPENVLFMMTSNRIDALDPALLRPGRIDYRLYLGEATRTQKVELYRRFFPLASEIDAALFVETHREEVTMAEFQGLLLRAEQEAETIPEPAELLA